MSFPKWLVPRKSLKFTNDDHQWYHYDYHHYVHSYDHMFMGLGKCRPQMVAAGARKQAWHRRHFLPHSNGLPMHAWPVGSNPVILRYLGCFPVEHKVFPLKKTARYTGLLLMGIPFRDKLPRWQPKVFKKKSNMGFANFVRTKLFLLPQPSPVRLGGRRQLSACGYHPDSSGWL